MRLEPLVTLKLAERMRRAVQGTGSDTVHIYRLVPVQKARKVKR